MSRPALHFGTTGHREVAWGQQLNGRARAEADTIGRGSD